MNAAQVRIELRQAASAEKATILARFFKTGRGQYGEGDQFLGVVVPEQRKIVRRHFADKTDCTFKHTLSVVRELIRNKYHEERLTSLLMLVELFKKSREEERKILFDFYLQHLNHINNWDLVDLSAPNIVGVYLLDKDSSILFSLANSGHLWTRRVAVLATFAFIKTGRFDEILSMAETMLIDKKEKHDLMHKAIGWMLREVGKRDQGALKSFLDRFGVSMPRTALRYAIERFPEAMRREYLRAGR
jgi:3-methyladenine DNA glycosylase AlkD